MGRIVAGLGLQGLCILTGYMSVRILYSGCWLGILVVSTPLFFAGAFVLMKSAAPLWARLIMSFWPLILPFTNWELWL